MQVNFQNLGRHITWRNGLFAAAALLAVVCVANVSGARAYSASAEADPAIALQGWLLSVAPGALAALAGLVASFLGVPPEYVAAMKAFAKNPDLEAIEKRAVNAAFEFILPRFDKYPELLMSLLRTIAPQFVSDPEVAKAISALGQALAKNFLSIPAPESEVRKT